MKTRQVRGERVVEKILDATVEVLAEKGYGGLSFEEIAARAEVAKTTVYRRWPTKVDLVVDAMGRLANEIVKVPDTGTLREDLMVMLVMFREFVWSPRGQSLLRMAVAEGPDSEVARVARRIREEKRMVPHEVVEQAVARGELPAGTDAQLVLDMLFAMVQHYLCFMHVPCTDAQLRQFIDVVLVGAQHGGAITTTSRPRTSSKAPAKRRAKTKRA